MIHLIYTETAKASYLKETSIEDTVFLMYTQNTSEIITSVGACYTLSDPLYAAKKLHELLKDSSNTVRSWY